MHKSFFHVARNGLHCTALTHGPCRLTTIMSTFQLRFHLCFMLKYHHHHYHYFGMDVAVPASQVWRGRPDRWFQSLGKGVTLARGARRWSADGSARVMWPKNFRRVVRMMCVSGVINLIPAAAEKQDTIDSACEATRLPARV